MRQINKPFSPGTIQNKIETHAAQTSRVEHLIIFLILAGAKLFCLERNTATISYITKQSRNF